MTYDDTDEPFDDAPAYAPPVIPDGDECRPLTPGEFVFYRNRGTFDGTDLSKWEPVVGSTLGHTGCLCYRPRHGTASIIRNGE